jgi:hypothetical protein
MGDGGDAGDASLDAPQDGTLSDGSGIDGSDMDGSVEGASMDGAADAIDESDSGDGAIVGEGGADASPDSGDASSIVCGDGIRDPQTEECDDGVVSQLEDSCTSLCWVRDLLVSQPALDGGSQPSRTLGTGRHPIGSGSSGFAVAWIEPKSPVVRLTTYDLKGVPSGWFDTPSIGTTALTTSAPGVAALPNGKYAVAFTDFNGDGDEEGIALRLVAPNNLSMGAPTHANMTTNYSQFDPDILWTGNDLVVAWVDNSNGQTGPDIRYRTFDSSLMPTSNELTLAGTSALEMDVSLAPWQGNWAVAWREASGGFETIQVKTSTNVAWSVGPFQPGSYSAPPALAELDATHLLVVFLEGIAVDGGQPTGPKLRAAILDTNSPGSVSAVDVPSVAQQIDAGSQTLAADRPALIRTGGRVFLSYWTEAAMMDPNGEELWLREIGWSNNTLDWSPPERTLPRWSWHRGGDQRFPALAASPLGPGGAIVSAWNDLGNVFGGSEANGDIAVQLIPVPVLRNVNADGGGQ